MVDRLSAPEKETDESMDFAVNFVDYPALSAVLIMEHDRSRTRFEAATDDLKRLLRAARADAVRAAAKQDQRTLVPPESVQVGEERVDLETVDDVAGWAIFTGSEGEDPGFHAFFVSHEDAEIYLSRMTDFDSEAYLCDPCITAAVVLEGSIVSANHFDDKLGAIAVAELANLRSDLAHALVREAVAPRWEPGVSPDDPARNGEPLCPCGAIATAAYCASEHGATDRALHYVCASCTPDPPAHCARCYVSIPARKPR